MFFFEKKNQKNFYPLGSATGTARAEALATPRNQEKVFLLLFLQKKKVLP